MRELILKSVTVELEDSKRGFDPAVLTDEIMKQISYPLHTSMEKRSAVLSKLRFSMEQERLRLVEEDARVVLRHIFAEKCSLNLADDIVGRVSDLVSENIKEILHYPVVKQEIQRSLLGQPPFFDENVKADMILKALVCIRIYETFKDVQRFVSKCFFTFNVGLN